MQRVVPVSFVLMHLWNMFGSSFFSTIIPRKGIFLVSLYAKVKLTKGTFYIHWTTEALQVHLTAGTILSSLNIYPPLICSKTGLLFQTHSYLNFPVYRRAREPLGQQNILFVKMFLLFVHGDDISTEDCISVTLNLMFVLFVHVYSTSTNRIAIGMFQCSS